MWELPTFTKTDLGTGQCYGRMYPDPQRQRNKDYLGAYPSRLEKESFSLRCLVSVGPSVIHLRCDAIHHGQPTYSQSGHSPSEVVQRPMRGYGAFNRPASENYLAVIRHDLTS